MGKLRVTGLKASQWTQLQGITARRIFRVAAIAGVGVACAAVVRRLRAEAAAASSQPSIPLSGLLASDVAVDPDVVLARAAGLTIKARVAAGTVVALAAVTFTLTGALGGNASDLTRTTSFAGRADAHVSSTEPNTNYGTESRLWASDSPWNTPIPSNPVIDSGSETMIADLATGGAHSILWKRYGVATFYANASTPRYTVRNTKYNTDYELPGVPIPSEAWPAGGDDGHLTIIDIDPASPTYQCAYDMLSAGTTSLDGPFDFADPRAEIIQRSKITESGWIQGISARGSSAANMGGAITPDEINSGRIPHALGMYVDLAQADNGKPYFPSYTADGTAPFPKIPEGARVRLNPAYDESALPVWQQTIARALKEFGAYVIDQGGNSFVAVDNSHGGMPGSYPWGTTTYPALPLSLLQGLQVLSLGARTTETYSQILTHPCGDVR